VLTYVNSFLADIRELRPEVERQLFPEAEALGYLVVDGEGETILIPNTDFSAALLDLTNPDAVRWFKDVVRDEVLGVGASGYMADFSEALPFEAALFNGQTGAEFHNEYPVAWAKLHAELAEELGRDDILFFTRAGYTQMPKYTRLEWLGDQLVDFGGDDGMYSALKGMLSGGLSGVSLNHSDIGGFTTINVIVFRVTRTQELFFRWAEMNAFSAAYRTHDGIRPQDNHQFHTEPATTAHFAKYAKVYKSLGFYLRTLMDEASTRGRPVVRHTLLHYPDDPVAWTLDRQFLYGSEILVAPVLEAGATEVTLYLPAGSWVHLWTGEVMGDADAGVWVDVPAPLGEIPAFYKLGSLVGEEFEQNLRDEGVLTE